MRELRDIYRSESFKQGVFSFELVEDSVYEWNVFLHSVDSDSVLYKDLEKWKEQSGQDYIQLNFHFNDMFPIEPPFVRIVSPVITGMSNRSQNKFHSVFTKTTVDVCREFLFRWWSHLYGTVNKKRLERSLFR